MGVTMLRRLSSLVAVLAFAGVANAALLAPGTSVVPSPTVAPGGAVLADTGLVPFSAVDVTSFSGTLRTRVMADPANPFGGAASLTFVYDLSNDAVSPDHLERLTTRNFTGYLTDANTFGPGVIPTTADRSASGAIIGWDYTGPPSVPPGGSSSTLILYTNATTFNPVINSVINGSVATVASYGPGPIPEPGTLAIVGIAGAALIARRRSR